MSSNSNNTPRWIIYVGGLASIATIISVIIAYLTYVQQPAPPPPTPSVVPRSAPTLPSPPPPQPPPPSPSVTGTTPPPDSDKWTLVLDDPLNDNSKRLWNQNNESCQFPGQGYHVITQSQQGVYCSTADTQSLNFKDFVYRVTMTFAQGGYNSQGGIIFRYDGKHRSFYYFTFNAGGLYTLGVVQNGAVLSPPLKWGSSYYFHRLSSNLLAVVVVGNRIDFSVNGQHIGSVVDFNNTLSNGRIGVYTLSGSTYTTETTEVVFSSVQVWTPKTS